MASDYVTIKTFSIRPEADRAYEILHSAGIQSMIVGDDAGGWAPYIGSAQGGIAVVVNQEDADKARQVLEEYGL